MPYNGSGGFAVVNTFTPATTISSSQMNSNFSDIATGLSNVLVRDGQGSGMTGQFKAADGIVSAPGIAFALDLNTGFRRSAADTVKAVAGGVDIFNHTTTGVTMESGKTFTLAADPAAALQSATKQYVDNAISNVAAAGTRSLFQQTSAPTGWTKDLTHNDKALRVVTGTASSGGTVAFSTVFAQTVTGGTAITIAQMPSHGHPFRIETSNNEVLIGGPGGFTVSDTTPQNFAAFAGTPTSTNGQQIGGTGGGATHNHAMDIRVQFVDVIICVKN
jgi:hypothetical protein